MQRSPSLADRFTRNIQGRINRVVPEKIHNAITAAIRQMIKIMLFSAEYTNPKIVQDENLQTREIRILERIRFYRNAAATEGAITGAGGILMGLADFPLWLTLKMKMLCEIAALYGFDVSDYKERIFILHVFQITFSSQQQRQHLFLMLDNWDIYKEQLPDDINKFDWRNFQQEYRDYIDFAKLLQLIPGIGAAVGAYVNHRLTDKLGLTAMQAYRMRWDFVH